MRNLVVLLTMLIIAGSASAATMSAPANGRCWSNAEAERFAQLAVSEMRSERAGLPAGINGNSPTICKDSSRQIDPVYNAPLCSGQHFADFSTRFARSQGESCTAQTATKRYRHGLFSQLAQSKAPAAAPAGQRSFYDLATAAVAKDAQGWNYDSLVSGSVRPSSVATEGGYIVVRGTYDVLNALMGNPRKSFTARISGGQVVCLEYSSYPGVCAPVRSKANRTPSPPPQRQEQFCVNGRGEIVGSPDMFGSCGPQ